MSNTNRSSPQIKVFVLFKPFVGSGRCETGEKKLQTFFYLKKIESALTWFCSPCVETCLAYESCVSGCVGVCTLFRWRDERVRCRTCLGRGGLVGRRVGGIGEGQAMDRDATLRMSRGHHGDPGRSSLRPPPQAHTLPAPSGVLSAPARRPSHTGFRQTD